MPATTTKAPSKAEATAKLSADDRLQMELDNARAIRAANLRLLQQIEQRHEDLEPSSLNLSVTEWVFFDREFDLKSPFDILHLLRRVRFRRALREQVGPAEVLSNAQAKLAAAEQELQTTAAAADQLATVEAGNVPVLARQIKLLQAKLDKLTAARDAAAHELGSIKSSREMLRTLAPDEVRRTVEYDLIAVKRSNEIYKRWCKARTDVDAVKNLLEKWNAEGRYRIASDPLYVHYCRAKFPSALIRNGAAVDFDAMATEIRRIETEGLAASIAERDQLQSQWEEIKRTIERPIELWMETGEAEL